MEILAWQDQASLFSPSQLLSFLKLTDLSLSLTTRSNQGCTRSAPCRLWWWCEHGFLCGFWRWVLWPRCDGFGCFRFLGFRSRLIWFSDLDGGSVMVLVNPINTGTASHHTAPEWRYTSLCGTIYSIGIYHTALCGTVYGIGIYHTTPCDMVSKYPKNRTVYTPT